MPFATNKIFANIILVNREFKKQLPPLLAIFILTTVFWIFHKVAWYQFIFLYFGLYLGSIFLELDHLIYWFYLHPELEESRLAKAAWKKGDFKSLLKLLESTRHKHTSLIFHHYFFQIILIPISFFVFTSSSNIFIKAFTLALNLHLLTKVYFGYKEDPELLKSWLFAREKKQLPNSYIKYYLYIFLFFNLIFILLIILSR